MGWMNGNDEGYEPGCTRFARHIGLKPATNRNTQCHWVTILGVDILFSYRTAMAFNKPGEGCYRRADTISRTTKRHMSDANVDGWKPLEDGAFEQKLGRAILGEILRSKDILEEIIGVAVSNKLVPEVV